MISDLDLFTIVLGYIYINITLASRDRLEDRSDIKRDGVSSIRITLGKL
jgi:hypothetical protein